MNIDMDFKTPLIITVLNRVKPERAVYWLVHVYAGYSWRLGYSFFSQLKNSLVCAIFFQIMKKPKNTLKRRPTLLQLTNIGSSNVNGKPFNL